MTTTRTPVTVPNSPQPPSTEPSWVRGGISRTYYHAEWGGVQLTQQAIFEHLCLLIFQQGLQWNIVLKFRNSMADALAHFNPKVLASWGEEEIEQYLANPSVIRNRSKVSACIDNAKALEAHQIDLAEELSGRLPSPLQAATDDASLPRTHSVTDELSDYLQDCGLNRISPVLTCSLAQACGLIVSNSDTYKS